MKRTYVSELKVGQKILLKGWVHEIRSLAKLSFILFRDSTGLVQCITKDSKIMGNLHSVTLESVVEIKGKVKKAHVKAEFARHDIEVEISSVKIINKAEKLPIHVNEKTTKTDDHIDR